MKQWSVWVSFMFVEWQCWQVVCFGGVIMVLGVFWFCSCCANVSFWSSGVAFLFIDGFYYCWSGFV